MVNILICLIERSWIQKSPLIGIEIEFQNTLVDRVYRQDTLLIGTIGLV